MRTSSNEILVYYNPEHSVAKQVLAYARSITPHILEVEYHKTKYSTRIWRQLLDYLGETDPKRLLNKAHPFYQTHLKGRDFNREDILNIIIRNPDIIRAPIAMRGKTAVFCENPTDVLRLGVLAA
jgi:arsenate reductase